MPALIYPDWQPTALDNIPELKQNTFHVWKLRLDGLSFEQVEQCARDLSVDERQRASRLVDVQLYRRYVVAHAGLRALLATYLEGYSAKPAQLSFSIGPFGKPYLNENKALKFNLSHSAELALIAVAWNAEIGVDIERNQAGIGHEALITRYFSEAERKALMNLPARDRLEAFYSVWTQKEAILKACGEGLSIPTGDFDVAVDRNLSPRLLGWRYDARPVASFYLQRLYPADGYSACLAGYFQNHKAAPGDIWVNTFSVSSR